MLKGSRHESTIERHFKRVAEHEVTPNELRFNPTTGELVLAPRAGPASSSPDGIVIDQIAEDGFFAAAPPRVLLHEAAVSGLRPGETRECRALARDDVSVIHVHGDGAPERAGGLGIRCILAAVAEAEFAAASELLETTAAGRAHCGEIGIAVVVSQDARLAAASLVRDGRAFRCAVRFAPTREELYSRASGLLETDALARRKVGIVGVGSGGSAIALELAKAGVGRFVLIDPDLLEPANVSRHACGVSDLGRYKVHAVRDAIHERNPCAAVEDCVMDINEDMAVTLRALEGCDLLVGATDGNRSRSNINHAALELGVPALFGRAITRAAGGDVLRVRPRKGPCLACIFALGAFRGDDEEISVRRQADRDAPSYVSEGEREAMVQPGLAADIAPISNMVTRLALVELSRGTDVTMPSLDEDLNADFYIWANRRERTYSGWSPMGCGAVGLSVLRWYGVRTERNRECVVCGEAPVRHGAPALHEGPPPSWVDRSADS